MSDAPRLPEGFGPLAEILAKEAALGDEPPLPGPPPAVVMPKIEPTPAPEAPPRKRAVLYSSSRRGYMRSSREEGIRSELDEMSKEASGSPLFGAHERQAERAVALKRLGVTKK